jgi:hypothetical protein
MTKIVSPRTICSEKVPRKLKPISNISNKSKVDTKSTNSHVDGRGPRLKGTPRIPISSEIPVIANKIVPRMRVSVMSAAAEISISTGGVRTRTKKRYPTMR